VRVVAHVLPTTADALEREREESGAIGVGTVASQWLDERAERARKRKG
jgi:hypothetical protein